jgi:tyrosyl-tRNA synthetase
LEKKIKNITKNLAEIMNHEKDINKIKYILLRRSLRIYWGTATTKAPHIAYFVPLSKLADFLDAGCTVIILLADLHAFLDSLKTPWFLLDARVEYYQKVLTIMFRLLGVSIRRLKFIRGRDFQMKPESPLDLYKLASITRFSQAQKAGSEVVKQDENPMLAPILYPLLQALDEEYLNVDVQFGGVDQRKIFAYASDFFNKKKNRLSFAYPFNESNGPQSNRKWQDVIF